MPRKVMITCAVTGSSPTTDKSPHVPVTPEEIARACIESHEAGASIVHIHVRDPKTKKASMDLALYEETVKRIKDAGCPVLINLTTGAGSRFVPDPDKPGHMLPDSNMKPAAVRVAHVEALKPEFCTLDVGTINKTGRLMFNTTDELIEMAKRMRAVGTKPELEIFDVGAITFCQHMIDQGLIESPPLYQLCLGIPWGAPATPETMILMRDLLPKDAVWAAFGIAAMQFPMAAQAVLLGGHVRVGLEDNLYLEKGVLGTDAQLVAKAAGIIRDLGEEVASVDDAREILQLGSARKAQAAE